MQGMHNNSPNSSKNAIIGRVFMVRIYTKLFRTAKLVIFFEIRK